MIHGNFTILLHASINTAGILPELFPAPNIPVFTMMNMALFIGLAIPALLILILTRGRLGYQPAQDEPFRLGETDEYFALTNKIG